MEELMKLLSAYLKEDVDVGAVSKTVGKFVEDYTKTQVTGLAKENAELTKAREELTVKYSELSDKYKSFEDEEVSFDAYSQLKTDFEALKSSTSQTDTQKIFDEAYNKGKDSQKKALDPEFAKLQKQIEKLNAERGTFEERYVKMNKETALRGAIEKMGIKANEFVLDGLKARMQSDYNSIEDTFSHKMFHDGNMLPIEDFITQFPQTEIGKSMIPAPVNTGGGATGSNSAGSNYTPDDLRNMKANDPKAADILKSLGYNF